MLTELLDAISSAAASATSRPILVAIDGRSGAGKSTLAAAGAAVLPSCTVVEGDDFYAGGPEERWDTMSMAERAEQVIDWRRQRPVLEALAQRTVASWHGYDWDAFDGRLRTNSTTAQPADVVLLEGAYSSRPQLADLLDLRVLVELDDAVRRHRLRLRGGDDYAEEWAARWSAAEDHYFESVVPRDGFDLIMHAD